MAGQNPEVEETACAPVVADRCIVSLLRCVPSCSVKVRLQTEGASGRFRGPIQCVLSTVREEGFLSLYKGVSPPLLGTGVINALVFGMQGMFVAKVKDFEGVPQDTQATVAQTAKAAVVTGVFISVVVTPIEGVKSRLQVQYHALGKAAHTATAAGAPAPLYTGPRSCIAYVVKNQGERITTAYHSSSRSGHCFRAVCSLSSVVFACVFSLRVPSVAGPLGLYRGFLPVMFCRMSNYAYFGAYEFWKGVYARAMPGQAAVVAANGTNKPTKGAAVFSGGMAGFCYWFSCYPMVRQAGHTNNATQTAQHNTTQHTHRSRESENQRHGPEAHERRRALVCCCVGCLLLLFRT